MNPQKLTLQKSASRLRFQSNIESHTKNKLINSLINQKLSQQKEQVLNRYVNLAKKASEEKLPSQQQSQFQIRKRASSLKNLSVSMEKIKESLTFNSVNVNVNKNLTQEAQFIISRQYQSPIVSKQEVSELNGLRQKSGLFEVKLTSKDKTGLEYWGLGQSEQSSGQKDSNKVDWVQRVQESVDNQLWLPGSPHVQMLLEDLQDSIEELRVNSPNLDQILIVKSPVFNEYGNSFKPVISSNDQGDKSHKKIIDQSLSKNKSTLSTKLIPIHEMDRQEILYDFKKYHKDDYIALDKWFEKNVLLAHKKHHEKKKHTHSQQTLATQTKPKHLLNLLYTIHIAGLQELIRLSYIQTWQKALVHQKILWSLVRLFSSLIEEQHKINYSQYKLYQKQIKEQRQMYEERCTKLQIMMVRAQTEAKSTQTLREKLSLAYVTYSRVNSHLYKELQFTSQRLSSLEHSFNFVNLKLMRLVDLLNQENRIKIIVTEFQTVYYLKVGQNDKLQELLRVKTSIEERKKIAKKTAQNQLKQQMEKQSKPLSDPKNKDQFQKAIIKKRQQIEAQFQSIHPQEVFQTRIGQRISNVEHELNKYWLNKQQSLKVKEITHQELLNYTTTDIGTSTIEKFQSRDYGMQFPEEKQKSFAEFLKEQIQKERNQHKKQIVKQEDLYVSLKELYEESYSKVKMLQGKNKELTLELDNTLKLLQKRQEKISSLESELSLKTADLLIKTQTIQSLLKQKRQLQKFITEQAQSSQQLERKFSIQIENSQTLVRNNFKMRDEIKILTDKFAEIEKALDENKEKKGQVEMELQHTESDLNEYREKYEKLHKNLLKIAPSVDSFLEFKRYDRQSIVIASVKKDLEKYFPEYFCKDSDVFLTK